MSMSEGGRMETVLDICKAWLSFLFGSGQLSWEDAYREMAADGEDWSDFDVAVADGLD